MEGASPEVAGKVMCQPLKHKRVKVLQFSFGDFLNSHFTVKILFFGEKKFVG